MSNLRSFAEHELRLIGMLGSDDEMNAAMADHILKMVDLFAAEGHSGFSAPYAINALNQLLRFEPLTPLTGDDEEWMEVTDGLYQNKRCSRVFKKDGKAYDIEGIVWRDKDGSSYTNWESRTPVAFPYTPRTEIRDRA